MLPVIVKKQCFRASFSFVVTGTWPDRINVTPVVLFLWMYRGIAIDFTGGRLEYPCLDAFGETQHVDCAMDAGLGRLHGVVLVMHRRSRTGQIIDLVNLDI